MEMLGLKERHHPCRKSQNNSAENAHLVIRRRARTQRKFKSRGSAQRFLASHGLVCNALNLQPHLISRPGLRTLRAKAELAGTTATIAA